ncbi:hypothetical protein GCM10022277_38200 [Litoribacillus peritrichatus]|uniref:Transposase n=1 Tax=Litoribacillus peritrichatus TaxID=718191 RepID=A0ABP7N8U4_9GAMM
MAKLNGMTAKNNNKFIAITDKQQGCLDGFRRHTYEQSHSDEGLQSV